jgi:hypothetical protein
VGQAALNGLYTNPCGWADPAGTGPGHTPFSLVDAPLRQPPGAGIFANATAASAAQAGQLAAELTHYALAGTLGTGGTPPPAPAVPTHACLGSPDVPVG